MITRGRVLAGVVALAAMIVPLAASAARPGASPGAPQLLASLAGGAASGSAIGPGGALYVPQPATGEIWRIDPRSGAKTLYASGLPTRFRGFRSAVSWTSRSRDRRRTRLSASSGQRSRPTSSHVIRGSGSTASTGRRARPSSQTSAVRMREPAAADLPDRGSDRRAVRARAVPRWLPRHRRAPQPGSLRDARRQRVRDPAVRGRRPDRAGRLGQHGLPGRGGPVPHLPQNGKVVSFRPGASTTTDVAAGARLAVDVELVGGAHCSRSRRATSRARTRTTARAPPGLLQIPTRALCCGRTTTERSRRSPAG